MEAVRLARFVGTFDDHVEPMRTKGSTTVLRIVWRTLPRNGGRALFLLCPTCDTPRRHFYGWEWIVFRGARTRSGESVGGAGHALYSDTLPKAAISAVAWLVGANHWA